MKGANKIKVHNKDHTKLRPAPLLRLFVSVSKCSFHCKYSLLKPLVLVPQQIFQCKWVSLNFNETYLLLKTLWTNTFSYILLAGLYCTYIPK